MRSCQRIRLLCGLAITLCASGAAGSAMAGTMDLEWDPVPGAHGYRVYYGFQSGVYTQSVNVGPTTRTTLNLPQDCTPYYVAVKAYNSAGVSEVYSGEVSGWARPELDDSPQFTQGGQFAVSLDGANFDAGTTLVFDAVDAEGQPLVRLEAIDVVSCSRLDALVTVEPTAAGARAMEIGTHELAVVSSEGVFGEASYEVELEPSRIDINQSDSETTGHVDGQDLVWLAYAYGSEQGEERFNADADLSGDGMVDGDDLAFLASVYGACWDGAQWEECP